mgnify:CR=1 FL=1
MRLIDADALKKDLKSVTLSNGTLVNTNDVLYLLEEYPTAYDVNKVVEQLEEYREEIEQFGCGSMLADMIEIVKGGGVDGN